MTQPPPDVWLDLVEADKQLLRYKRGQITKSDALIILMRDCGVPSHIALKAIKETDDTALEVLEKRASEEGVRVEIRG